MVNTKNITDMIYKYNRCKLEEFQKKLNYVSEVHKCDYINEVNRLLNTNETNKLIYKKDDIDWVYLIKDIKNGVWEMCTSYWNDEYNDFEVASIPVLICPYCGEKLA
ncbi:hypothetical protein [Clostridium estertheticum]|uniref:hypothetical protein n=1 Tax=Clostridium estertheticum TaxID=238834 RepID=UPI001C0DE5FC|nr:hypothetical protein [Clostridium estertheticum]MBU3173264.1 hypothetical protein [Clostridium estertheticum]